MVRGDRPMDTTSCAKCNFNTGRVHRFTFTNSRRFTSINVSTFARTNTLPGVSLNVPAK